MRMPMKYSWMLSILDCYYGISLSLNLGVPDWKLTLASHINGLTVAFFFWCDGPIMLLKWESSKPKQQIADHWCCLLSWWWKREESWLNTGYVGCRLDWNKARGTLNTQPVLLQITRFKSLKLHEMRCLLLMCSHEEDAARQQHGTKSIKLS